MTLEKAFSLEIRKNISASEADNCYKNQEIKDKRKFICPSENCNAQVTCANLDKEERLRKREPYFKIVGDHSEKCSILKDLIEKKGQVNRQKRRYKNRQESSTSGIFHFNRNPPSNKKLSQKNNSIQTGVLENKKNTSILRIQTKNKSNNKINYNKRLSSLVVHFKKGGDFIVGFNGEDQRILSKDLFIKINEQSIAVLPNAERIYWGEAWINDMSQNKDLSQNRPVYSVRFKNKIRINNGNTLRPTLPIWQSVIDKSEKKTYYTRKLKDLCDKQLREVYLSVKKSKLNGSYLNFELNHLHLMYISEL